MRNNRKDWQVTWQQDEANKSLSFFSVSSDGRVTLWTLSKNELQHSDVMILKLAGLVSADQEEPDEQETSLVGLAGGSCIDFNIFTDHLFLVGTEEGRLHKCSKAYNSQYLDTYEVCSSFANSNFCARCCARRLSFVSA